MSLENNTAGLEEILASVNALPEAGGGTPTLQEKTVTPTLSEQTVTYDAGYDGLSKVTVNGMPTTTTAAPSISVSSGGLITAKTTQTAGYVTAGVRSTTKQLPTVGAETITPGTSQRTVALGGYYTTGEITVAGDANLVAGNIKSGVSIFGVAGNYEGSGGGVTNETCEVIVSGSGYSDYYPTNIAYTSVDSSGKVIGVNQAVTTASVTITCVKGSTLAVGFRRTVLSALTNASLLFFASSVAVYKLDDNATTAAIRNGSSGAGGND